jgi:RNA polymerase sigma-70 factor (ECF subfamily)
MTVGPPGVGMRDEDREESDARLIERSRDEPELFAVLYDRYADTVHRYAVRRLGPEAAEDLMAETFVMGPGATAATSSSTR